MDGHMLIHPGRGDPRKKEGGSFFFTLCTAPLRYTHDNPPIWKGVILNSHYFCRLVGIRKQLRPELWVKTCFQEEWTPVHFATTSSFPLFPFSSDENTLSLQNRIESPISEI